MCILSAAHSAPSARHRVPCTQTEDAHLVASAVPANSQRQRSSNAEDFLRDKSSAPAANNLYLAAPHSPELPNMFAEHNQSRCGHGDRTLSIRLSSGHPETTTTRLHSPRRFLARAADSL